MYIVVGFITMFDMFKFKFNAFRNKMKLMPNQDFDLLQFEKKMVA